MPQISKATIPRIGQGTWNLGEDGLEAIRVGVDLGLTHIDTAEMYGNEEVLGQAIRGLRSKVFLASKVLPSHASYKGTIAACNASLKRLGTDHLDLYLLHWWSRHNPIEETMRAMEHLVEAGKVRHVGVSNFDIDEMKRAQKALSQAPLACNQVLYHLRSRGIEHRLIRYCEKHGIAVVGYSPFGQGNFPTPRSKQGIALSQIAKKYGKTERQVALNFLVRKQSLFAIPKSSNVAHVRENAGALGWTLDADDLKLIDRAFPLPEEDGPLDMA